MKSRHISCVIHATPEAVYEYASNPDNLARWAQGLAKAEVKRDGDDLVADSPMGQVRVRFVPRNSFGVLDHDVTLPSGITINNPVRVIAHPDGSEIMFTIRQIALTDDEFERDCQMVGGDLRKLRDLIES